MESFVPTTLDIKDDSRSQANGCYMSMGFAKSERSNTLALTRVTGDVIDTFKENGIAGAQAQKKKIMVYFLK